MEICGAAIGEMLELTQMAQDTTTDMENLATDATTDRNTFNDSTRTISDQYSQITTLTNKLLSANESAEKLKTGIMTINSSNGYSGRGSGGRGDNQINSQTRRPLEPNCYC